MNTKSTRHVVVGTVKKSHATMSLTWLLRKAFHVGDEGFASSRPILLHRGFSYADAELPEFSHDAR
jgi:hypothetical protein